MSFRLGKQWCENVFKYFISFIVCYYSNKQFKEYGKNKIHLYQAYSIDAF